jgi:hypothetical protein
MKSWVGMKNKHYRKLMRQSRNTGNIEHIYNITQKTNQMSNKYPIYIAIVNTGHRES